MEAKFGPMQAIVYSIYKFGANCLNSRNLNVRTVEVQLDSVANTKLPGIKIDNCF